MKNNSLRQSRNLHAYIPSLPVIVALLVVACVGRETDTPGKTKPLVSNTPSEGSHWIVPPGWIERVPPRRLELASFTIPSESGDGEVVVVRIEDYEYGLLPNVNRWRSQIGLEPINGKSMSEVSQSVEAASGELGNAFRFVGTKQTILSAAFVRGDTKWFFKLIAPNSVAELQKESFDTFIASFHL